MDEEQPLSPIDSYALSKVFNEKPAEMFHRKTDIQIVSLRIGNVMESDDYDRFPAFEAEKRKNILWSYIDARDVASACRLAIEKDGLDAVILNIASDDTSMSIKSNELMATNTFLETFCKRIASFELKCHFRKICSTKTFLIIYRGYREYSGCNIYKST